MPALQGTVPFQATSVAFSPFHEVCTSCDDAVRYPRAVLVLMSALARTRWQCPRHSTSALSAMACRWSHSRLLGACKVVLAHAALHRSVCDDAATKRPCPSRRVQDSGLSVCPLLRAPCGCRFCLNFFHGSRVLTCDTQDAVYDCCWSEVASPHRRAHSP
eukprot:3324343-Rhodomonas_salina.1